jgi:hypothetical protein
MKTSSSHESRQILSFAKLWVLIAIAVLVINIPHLQAKRRAPKAVATAVYGDTTYSAPNDNGRIGYILASDSAGKVLFQIRIFEIAIDPKLEEDVQWVFITELKLTGHSLMVTDEKARCYSVDLQTRAVKRKC